MAPPRPVRVLRCCSCHLFQAHQVTKSQKWTCKVCGEKQSFLRAYGEGSGADCRRHVQKLNVLQGQLSESRTGFCKEGQDEDDPRLDECARLQPRASESRWQKYLEGDSEDKTLLADPRQEPEDTPCRELPLKRRRSPNASPPPTSPGPRTAPRDVDAASQAPTALCAGTPWCLFQTGEDFEEDLL